MSEFYKRKIRGLYSPNSKEPYTVSRSGIDLFYQCPKCFYLDKRFGISRPPGFPFSLNSAVDSLLKKEFDEHRANGEPHPLMKAYGIDAHPFNHEQINLWRDSLRHGIKYHDEETNLIIRGGVDDIWINHDGELHIVDYKATSKSSEVNLDADWQDGYKRQVEIYQWLFRKNGFKVSDIAYFVYCNGNANAPAFDGKLEFDVKIIPYKAEGKINIEKTISSIQECLASEKIPQPGKDCDYCAFYNMRKELEE